MWRILFISFLLWEVHAKILVICHWIDLILLLLWDMRTRLSFSLTGRTTSPLYLILLKERRNRFWWWVGWYLLSFYWKEGRIRFRCKMFCSRLLLRECLLKLFCTIRLVFYRMDHFMLKIDCKVIKILLCWDILVENCRFCGHIMESWWLLMKDRRLWEGWMFVMVDLTLRVMKCFHHLISILG